MKKFISFSILFFSSTTLLAACSSQTQESQVTPSSSKSVELTTKTSDTLSSSTSIEATAETSTSAGQSQQSEQTHSSQTQENVLSSQTTQTQLQTLPATGIPNELVGKWQGTSLQARNIEVTVNSDGTITTYEDFRLSEDEEGDYLIQTYTAYITDLVEYSPNHYIIRGAEGEYSALLPGITGLGGRIAPGFILEDGQFKVIMWGNPADPEVEATYDLISEPHIYTVLSKIE
ncbi:TPA: hypothetical protein ACGO3Z_000500 [Streptococcus suis]